MNSPLRQRLEFLLLFLLIATLWYFGRQYAPETESLLKSLEEIPLIYRGITYVFLYVVVTFFVFFSKDAFWFAGALLFGAVWSTVFICVAEAVNAVILFHLSRSLGRAYTKKILKEKYSRLDERLGSVHFLWLFLFRSVPLIPYRFMDLAAGLTRISFRRYFAAVCVGSWLKMYWIQYILVGLGKTMFEDPSRIDPFMLLDYFLNNQRILWLSFIYVFLVVAVFLKIKRSNS